MRVRLPWFGCVVALAFSLPVAADDFFLTIGGGYSPSGNQASLEKNVLYFQRVLRDSKLDASHNDVFFSDGNSSGKDLQVLDPQSVPEANRLMAEFFGSRSALGLSYRNHEVPEVSGSTRPENIRKWFDETAGEMKPGDRLMLFVTAHGNKSRNSDMPYDTTIATWNNSSIKMTDFVKLLDELPLGVEVVVVMVQCHSGGFARMIFNGGDPDRGLSEHQRCGFFATVHDRPAAGCTPEVDESTYVEYSTYFWAALSGQTRTGELIERPDYNGDGVISFDEAHAYTILTADTIDLPIKTSGEYLSEYSKFGKGKDSDLLRNDESYELILSYATPTQRIVLEGLSEQLGLDGDDRFVDAWEALDENRRKSRSRRRGISTKEQLRRKISGDIKRKWPELANVLNPTSMELMTTRSEEFVAAIKGHRDYERYRKLTQTPAENTSKKTVKYDRFLRVADNIALAENLRRIGNVQHIAQYETLVELESRAFAD